MYFTESIHNHLVKTVREKKELRFLSKQFILDEFFEYCRLHKTMRTTIAEYSCETFAKSKELKLLVKHIRQKSRKIYGIFQNEKLLTKRELLKSMDFSNPDIISILQSHVSTKERLPYYEEFFFQIFTITGNPSSILDLACGLHPVAYYHFTKLTQTTYTACELSEVECEQLQDFFDSNGFKAKAQALNIVKEYETIPKAHYDVCFLLKTLDTCEHQRRYITYDILKAIHANFIVASFPIQNVKGIKMNRDSTIHWFEKMIQRLDFHFKTIEFEGEIVYILQKVTP